MREMASTNEYLDLILSTMCSSHFYNIRVCPKIESETRFDERESRRPYEIIVQQLDQNIAATVSPEPIRKVQGVIPMNFQYPGAPGFWKRSLRVEQRSL